MREPNPTLYQLVRGQVLHFLKDPGEHDAADSYQFFPDGALWIADGHIADIGPWVELQARIAPELNLRVENTLAGDGAGAGAARIRKARTRRGARR